MKETDIKVGVKRIVSGGQTGVDRGALDAAMTLGFEHGGWCPRGRLAEDGVIEDRYLLQEHPSQQYWRRTEQNVMDSDGTLILYVDQLSGGTELTFRMTKKHRQPCYCIDLSQPVDWQAVSAWLREHTIECLNVAGPRESSSPGIRDRTYQLLRQLFG